MADSYCLPCESRGIKGAAHRVVRDDQTGKVTPKCDFCWKNNRHVVEQQKGPTLAQLAERALGAQEPERAPLTKVVAEQPLRMNRIQFGPEANGKEKAVKPGAAVDWAAVDRDDAAGMAAADIAEKHGIDSQAVYNRRYMRRRKANAGAPAKTAKVPKPQASANGFKSKAMAKKMPEADSALAAAIAKLETRKQQIEHALEALRLLENL